MPTYTDPPEVLHLAAVLEQLPRWYLALMLARVLKRKTPAAMSEPGLKATTEEWGRSGVAVVTRLHGGGEVVGHAAASSARRSADAVPRR